MPMPKVEDVKREAAETPPLPAVGLALPVQVAEFLHTTTNALAQERYLGRGIPYTKHGSRVLYRWSDVHAYLDANRVTPGA